MRNGRRLAPLVLSSAVLSSVAIASLGCHRGNERTTTSSPVPSSAVGEQPIPLRPPDERSIPAGPMGEAIRRGKTLVTRTREELPDHVGNGLHCTSCHLESGARQNAGPWVGVIGVFPEYRSRNAKVNVLEERINDCFERSMNGKPLSFGSAEMNAIVAYMSWLSRGVPAGREVEGRGFKRIKGALAAPNPEHGKEIYAARCASCHGATGAGLDLPGGGYQFPALWGDRSFNIGAGMARLATAAAFVRWNMPLGQGGVLSDQDAYDVAEYFIHQPRPDFARKAEDWPKGDKPKDARY